jgi:hypothetical protein
MPRKVIREFAEPVSFDVTITGAKELAVAFDNFTPVLQKKIQRRVTRTIAYHLREKIKSVTPKLTGRMQANHIVRSAGLRLSAEALSVSRNRRRKTRKNIVGHKVKTGTRDKLLISAKDRYYYPAIVEFGAPKRNIKPNPYMRRTLKNQQRMARYLYRTLMAKEVLNTARELRTHVITPRGVRYKR